MTFDESNAVAPAGKHTLAECEQIIDAGLKTFWEVGSALAEVRDKRLWTDRYESFTDYLAKRWNLKPAYAGNLILAADIRAELTGHAAMAAEEDDKPPFELPDSVAGACALKRLDTEQKVHVLEQLREKRLPVTCENIRQEVEAILPTAPKIPKLSYGVLRNSIDALVRQSEFFDSIAPERLDELFATPDDREFAIETLTRIVGLLTRN